MTIRQSWTSSAKAGSSELGEVAATTTGAAGAAHFGGPASSGSPVTLRPLLAEGCAFLSVLCNTAHRFVIIPTPSRTQLQGVPENFSRNPLTSRPDGGLISGSWRNLGRGHPHDEPVYSPMPPVVRPRPAASPGPTDEPANVHTSPRAKLLVSGLFWRFCSFSALSPMFFYGDPHRRRLMRHHRHVPRCQQCAGSRRCRAQRRGGPDRRRSRSRQKQGTSRIALRPIREPRGDEAAGRGGSPAVLRDPDCRGRLAVKLLRLLGGRR